MKTEALGEVSIPLAKIRGVVTDNRAAVSLVDGRAVSGELRLLEDGAWEVRSRRGVQ